MKVSKMMDMSKDYAMDAMDVAKDYLPSAHQLAKSKMKADAKIAKGISHAMPAKVKKMEIAKMILLPAAGAVAALLLAPKSGKELRKDIKNKFSDVTETSMEKAQEWKEVGMEKAQHLKEVSSEKAHDWKETGMEKAQDLKEAGTEKMSRVADQAKEMKDEYVGKAEEAFDSSDMENDPVVTEGNVHGSADEPNEDQTIPADKLDEALEDVGVDSEDELLDDNKS